MKSDELVVQLEELAEKLGMEVRYDRNFRGTGGVCKVRDKLWLIMNRNLTAHEKVDVFVEALKNTDLNEMFIPPLLRELFGLEELSPECVHEGEIEAAAPSGNEPTT